MLRSSLVLLGCCWAIAARAESVVVFDTDGGKGVATTLVQTLTAELAGHEVKREAAQKGWKTVGVKLAPQLAKATKTRGAAAGVASELSKSRKAQSLAVLAVMADGRVVYDQVVKLPKKNPDKRIKELVRAMARSLREELAASQPVAAPTDVAPVGPAQPLVPQPVPVAGAASDGDSAGAPLAALGLAPRDEPPPAVEISSRRRRQGENAFHAAVRAGGGALTISDSISTSIQGGDLNIGVGLTLVVNAGLELALGNWLTFSADVQRYGATITHAYVDNPNTATVEPGVSPTRIGAAGLGTTALVGSGMEFGGLIGGLAAGVSYASFSADPQRLVTAGGEEPAALVPSWGRLALLVGGTLSYGNLGREGLTGQLALLVIPWGSHAEEPLTSGASSSLLGVNGWLRARYQFPDLFGSAGGLFGEVALLGELVRLQYEGNGTRKALGGTDPVQAAKETRTAFGGTLSVGYVY